MKRHFTVILILMFLTVILSCGVEDETDSDNENGSDTDNGEKTDDPEEIVVFPDPGLEKCVRKRIQKQEGDILLGDLEGVLSLNYCQGLEIRDLTGIEKITVLQSFQAGNNKIKDVTPLGKCVNLRELDLSDNEIEDASVLASLIEMNKLFLNNNKVANISFILKMVKLSLLNVSGNPITSISPLKDSSLDLLEHLAIFDCKISDITPVSTVKNLRILFINSNKIESLIPIKALFNLESITVEDNCINDFSPIDYLKENGKLTSVQGDSANDQDYSRCE